MELLKFGGALIFLFCFCYLIAAMGNHGKFTRRHQNDFGCAIILFVALIIGTIWHGIFGSGSIIALLALLLFGGMAIGGYFNWKKKQVDKKNRDS
jgi:general stress protein CsbA